MNTPPTESAVDAPALVGREAIAGLTLLEEIGRGAHAVLYRALRDGREVAVKVARAAHGPDGDSSAVRFRREAAVLACAHHPPLPGILEIGEAEGRSFIVCDLVPGRPLADVVAAGPLPEPLILRLAAQLAGALIPVG